MSLQHVEESYLYIELYLLSRTLQHFACADGIRVYLVRY